MTTTTEVREYRRRLERPVFAVGIWVSPARSDAIPPDSVLIAHSTADALATWLARNAPDVRTPTRRLRQVAINGDERWNACRDNEVATTINHLRVRRQLQRHGKPWLEARVMYELEEAA